MREPSLPRGPMSALRRWSRSGRGCEDTSAALKKGSRRGLDCAMIMAAST